MRFMNVTKSNGEHCEWCQVPPHPAVLTNVYSALVTVPVNYLMTYTDNEMLRQERRVVKESNVSVCDVGCVKYVLLLLTARNALPVRREAERCILCDPTMDSVHLLEVRSRS